MNEDSGLSLHHRLGRGLYRGRRWALVPLLGLGLFLDLHSLPVHTGIFMMAAGAVGVLFGTLLRIICFRFHAPDHRLDPSPAPDIITVGPYAVTRNPVYLGEAAFALGIAMMSRMPWLVMGTLVVVVVVSALIIDWEEHLVRHTHGQAYAEYCRRVPRWFSLVRLWQADSYHRTRRRVRLLTAIRAESATLLIALLSILAFLAKADLELFS